MDLMLVGTSGEAAVASVAMIVVAVYWCLESDAVISEYEICCSECNVEDSAFDVG